MYAGTGYRPASSQRIALGATREGRPTAIDLEGVAETSRYEEYLERLIEPARFPYSCPNVATRYRLAHLDVHTPIFMRRPGFASGIVALECAMDELAYQLPIDPVELRLLNEPDKDERTGQPFSSRSTRECYRIMVGGIGMALMEQTIVDHNSGRIANGTLADYLMPLHADIPALDAIFVEEHDSHVNPLGVKGLGEVAIVGVAPLSPTRSSTRPAGVFASSPSLWKSCFDAPNSQRLVLRIRERVRDLCPNKGAYGRTGLVARLQSCCVSSRIRARRIRLPGEIDTH
jgi:CO/xanthine dehydrogenase Mo-binding subunit